MSSSVMISYAVEAVGVAAAPTVVSIIDNFYRIDYSTVRYAHAHAHTYTQTHTHIH